MYCNSNINYVGGLVNSNVAQLFLNIVSPTLDYNAGYVSKIPYIEQSMEESENSINT